ncbi:MAG: glutamate synthase-related protein [Bacillota bacterium]
MFANGIITPNTLSLKDLLWQIKWDKERCTLCGRCTSVCPVQAIELGVHRKRLVQTPSVGELGLTKASPDSNLYQIYYGIRQKSDPAYACMGCAMCNLVCPNGSIVPLRSDEANKLKFHINTGGQARRRGGRRNSPDPIQGGILDRIKFVRISMLTDPALDAGRHEFELRTLLGRILPPEENLKLFREEGWIPPVREIYPLIIGSMSFGALSPTIWEGLQMGVSYLNEELGMPVRICTGEGGCPPRLLRSRFLKYVILQIASGYFGWDEIIHALPEMKEDPCAVEIKYGQGAKPGDGGLLMWYKVNKLIAAIRGVPQGVSLPSPPTHQTKYSIEEAVAKMIQSMYMAWGFRVPVYPKISGTSTALAVLNNLTRNPYAAGLAIDGEDGGTGAAYNVSMDHMGHPIASNLRDCYLNLVKLGQQNEIPLFAAGGVGKNGNLAANAAALIMLGASGVQIGKYIMQSAAGCVGSESDRCNICNIGLCPKGITSQDPRLYRRLDPEKVAERVVDVFLCFDTELKKIVAPLGRSTSLPIGMSDALAINDYNAAERLQIQYVV